MQDHLGEQGRPVIRSIADALRDEGRAEVTEDVLSVLDARPIPVSKDARQRILTCQDVAQLEQWLRRAVVANSVGNTFDI